MSTSEGAAEEHVPRTVERASRPGAGRVARTVLPVAAALLTGAVLVALITLIEWRAGQPLVEGTTGGVLLAVVGIGACLAAAAGVSRRLR
ncbi:MAG: hypothetical protein QOD04_811 [Pseudonocardiales bacterium]|nr:hypothetical protein [Pseudonocardiales bacterium]